MAGLEAEPGLLPPDIFVNSLKSMTLPGFTPHDFYYYTTNGVSH